MMIKLGSWFLGVLAVSATLTAGCAAEVDPDRLPGVYRDDETGGEISLGADGSFTATGISADDSTGGGGAELIDFHGDWEFVVSDFSSDFVYLSIEDDGLGMIGGVQLYTDGEESVEFRPDPDGPPSLVLTRSADA
ncbi:hypothetical protein AB0I28_35710 [Phytomonospora sp. NPDC050363]|uniref:hypothetical protein n=1 Tax=Phytomonospora sp. NPDC050363 TaxID=3155642 RepID=UPI0033E3CCEE